MRQVIVDARGPGTDGLGRLTQVAKLLGSAPADEAVVVARDHERVTLPAALTDALRELVRCLLEGVPVALTPLHRELTTQEAADLLGISRPHLVDILERESIPYTWTGRQRRIRFADLAAYQARRKADRRKHLDALVQLSEQLGLYEE